MTLHRLIIFLIFICLSLFLFGKQFDVVSKARFFEIYPIKKVQVNGEFRHILEKEVMDLLTPWVDLSLFTVDTFYLKSLIEQHEWVDYVQVDRVWPDELHFQIYEHEPIAIINETGLVSRRGKFFQPESQLDQWQKLPQLSGPEHQINDILEMYRQCSRILQLMTSQAVLTHLTLDAYNGWILKVNDIWFVRVDRDQPLAKLKRLADRVQQGAIVLEDIESVDLRYPHGVAVKWHESVADRAALASRAYH